jgi:hypothetical protein
VTCGLIAGRIVLAAMPPPGSFAPRGARRGRTIPAFVAPRKRRSRIVPSMAGANAPMP